MYTHCLRCMAWIALTNNMADTCVRLASRPGLCQTCIAPTVLDVVWRGLRLLTTGGNLSSAMRQLASKICNRYLAKIDIWYNSNL